MFHEIILRHTNQQLLKFGILITWVGKRLASSIPSNDTDFINPGLSQGTKP